MKIENGTWIHSKKRRPARRGDVRWTVWYRLSGGRSRRPLYAGTFKSQEDAEKRERLVGGWIAEGRGKEIPALLAQIDTSRTFAVMLEETLALMPNPSEAQRKKFRNAGAHLGALGALLVEDITRHDVQRWVNAGDERGHAPSTTQQYLGVIRQALDHADLGRPNPARDPRLFLPVIEEDEEFTPPTWDEFTAIIAAIAPKYRDLFTLIEGTGLRISEALGVQWADLDLDRGQLRVARNRTKGRTGGRRFVPLTAAAREVIERQPNPEADPSRAIFAGLTDNGARGALAYACKKAGITHYHPHDLRGRFISLCLIAGIPVEMVRKMAGHRKTSLTLDVYSHVVLSEPRWRLVELRRAVAVLFNLAPSDLADTVFPAQEGGEKRMEDTGIEPLDP